MTTNELREAAQRSAILEAVARGWCHPTTSDIEMDSRLAEAITDEVLAALTATTNEAAPALPADRPQPSQDDLITVAHITLEGVTLTLEINQLGDLVYLVGEEEQTYELRIAPMRRGDFEDLGEFDGF